MSTDEWLRSIHLEHYIPTLLKAGYDSTAKCASLTDALLIDIGVSLLGHRKRILAYLPKEDLVKLAGAASKAEMSDESSTDDNYYSFVEDESIYDVPPSHSHELLHIDDDIFDSGGEGPPVLPPKKKTMHGSIDERLGMVARLPEANPQRPVPVPRTSIVPKKPVPRPRTRRKSQKTSPAAESYDPGAECESDSPHGDNAGGLVQSQVLDVGIDKVCSSQDLDLLGPCTEDPDESHDERSCELEEHHTSDEDAVLNPPIYDDVYVDPDDIVVGSDGEITVVPNNKAPSSSDDEDDLHYIDMGDELRASLAGAGDDCSPGPLEGRVVIGAETTDEQRMSECLYGELWVMNSGETKPSNDTSLTQTSTRQSVMSFCAPPPSYAPPPLPEGVVLPPDLSLSDPAPPCVPPRPIGYKPWSMVETRPESIDFSNFISERFESDKLAELFDASCCQRSDTDSPIPDPTETALPSYGESSMWEDVKRKVDSRPNPPPRVPNPFQSMYDPISRTYSFDNDLATTEYVWDSDDCLSDGGDFFEEEDFQPSSLDKASIPVIPAIQNNITERKGYLYKRASKRSTARGWAKEWVTFDGKYLKYFSNDKSVISKRMIPLVSILNVTNGVKTGEPHPYRFQVITVDRVYTFATDEIDDLSLWANILMRAVIENELQYEEGGDMCEPKKEGFVKIQGAKGKRYLAVKSDQFAYYNTYNDYKAGCPIHMIEMKLASVKERSKMRLQLTTPYAAYMMVFDASEEVGHWKGAFEDATSEGLSDDTVLTEVYKNHSNRLCADCGQQDPHWASINIGITLCKHCAGIHRGLGVAVSKVRSLRMDMRVWTPSLIQMMICIGNDKANNFWEWNGTEEDSIDPDVDMQTRSQFILDKYRDKRICRFHPLRTNQQSLDEALCKSAQFVDVIETMHLLFSGANILHKSEIFNNETPLILARKAKQTLQVEFLSQNGGDGIQQGTPVMEMDAPPRSIVPSQKGYLYKTGSNQKGEFLRRWVFLDQGMLSYYENEKVNIAKDSIEKRDMLSIKTTTDDRFEFAFELNTTRHGGRVYLFAAETTQDGNKWVTNIAKNLANLPENALKYIQELDRGGTVFIQEGATNDWCQTWMHMKSKTLHLYNKENQEFEEIDLRKATGILPLLSTARCVETYDEGPPFVVDLHNRALYIQGDTRKETEDWFNAIHKASTESDTNLGSQQLTADDTPVIIDKCINFVAMHGLTTEGIYRHSGQHSKITELLKVFGTDARSVHLRLEDYSVHNVCTVMKRFLRYLEDPVFTHALYPKWLEASRIEDITARLQWYKYLLGELPRVNYMTLKKLTTHLCRVSEQQLENKMNSINIASIFGPVLMTKKEQDGASGGYGDTNEQICTFRDMLDNHQWLFEVKENELEHERKIEEAIRKMEQLSSNCRQESASDLLLGIHIYSIEGQVVMLKVQPTMTAEQVLKYVVTKAELDSNKHWGIFEVICGRELQRPLHFSEKVLDVTLCWGSWPDEYCRDNYLCVKENTIYEKVDLVFDRAHLSLYGELRFSERKGFKKFYFEFSQYKLMYHKDTKGSSPLCNWKVEDLTVYIGVQSKRSPPTRWGFTFIVTQEPVTRGKDNPFFGHSVCCNNETELYRWIAAMLHAQHAGGLEAKAASEGSGHQDKERSTSPSILNMPVPLDAGFNNSPKPHRQSLFRKLLKK